MKNNLAYFILSITLSIITISTSAQCVKTSCYGSSNTGLYSSAIGNATTSSANYAFSSGNQSTASGESSTALGYLSNAAGNYSFAVGYRPQALAQTAIAIGYDVKARYAKSFAIGEASESKAVQSYAIGMNCITNADGSFAIGRYMQTNASNSISLGASNSTIGFMTNDKPNSLMVGFSSTIPTLFVGDSPTATSTGKVGIGTSTPSANLHILSNSNENAILYLQNKQFTGVYYAGIFLGNQSHGITADGSNGLIFKTQKYYIFNDGNVGIGISIPLAKLHVEGTAKVTQTFTVGGSLLPASMNVFGPTVLTGSLKVTTLQSESASMIVADREGNLGVAPIPTGGDQMGSHIATRNIQMSGKFITSDESTSTSEGIFIGPTGNVGIKTSTIAEIDDFTVFAPSTKAAYLRVQSQSTNASVVWTTGGSKTIGMGVIGDKGYIFETDKDTKVITIKDGRVGIGVADESVATMSGTHKLFVSGGITSEEVIVKLKGNWPDNVFKNNYQLIPLSEVDQYIKINQHLPEIPSQTEVETDGINLGSMDALLLKKIEELTLYIIEQDKRIKQLENKL